MMPKRESSGSSVSKIQGGTRFLKTISQLDSKWGWKEYACCTCVGKHFGSFFVKHNVSMRVPASV